MPILCSRNIYCYYQCRIKLCCLVIFVEIVIHLSKDSLMNRKFKRGLKYKKCQHYKCLAAIFDQIKLKVIISLKNLTDHNLFNNSVVYFRTDKNFLIIKIIKRFLTSLVSVLQLVFGDGELGNLHICLSLSLVRRTIKYSSSGREETEPMTNNAGFDVQIRQSPLIVSPFIE